MKRLIGTIILSSMLAIAPSSANNVMSDDKEIKAVQAKILVGLQPSGQRQMTESQKAWEGFREAECRYRQSNYPLMTSLVDCRKALTHERLTDVKVQFEWLHGIAGTIDPAANSCNSAIGRTAADRLVRHCLSVSAATRPPCNAQNSCEVIKREIRLGCSLLMKDIPSFCKN